MLLKAETLKGILAGDIDLQFRRWRRPSVSAGGRLSTAIGRLQIGRVDVVDLKSLSENDARRAGFADLIGLSTSLRAGVHPLYRIEILRVEADPRERLREQTSWTADDRKALLARFERWNRRRPDYGRALLRLIEGSEGVAASQLAARLGVEVPVLKRDVRTLAGLGITQSLATGYRLAPRGLAALNWLAA